MPQRLFIDLKENCNGEVTGPVKLAADNAFNLEALSVVIQIMSESSGVPAVEICRDIAFILRSGK